MLFNHIDEITRQLKNIAAQNNGGVKIEDADKFRGDVVDQLVQNAVLDRKSVV